MTVTDHWIGGVEYAWEIREGIGTSTIMPPDVVFGNKLIERAHRGHCGDIEHAVTRDGSAISRLIEAGKTVIGWKGYEDPVEITPIGLVTTIAHDCASLGHLGSVSAIVKAGFDPSNLLFTALRYRHLDLVQRLIDLGARPQGDTLDYLLGYVRDNPENDMLARGFGIIEGALAGRPTIN